ncbi:ABC transporter permease [Luteolibacter arcticus]|uniref:Oligopeptide transport system permease protein OppC n=1 Tax=Luteolibacter arcticus TaxID=1581411 RepID=A0ABT3GC84_9BACT|nr:ABC transporter permease [Luteolibacter arcticus]MCW1921236.1 ABC transporter permease [Luteolibacter arcticus]
MTTEDKGSSLWLDAWLRLRHNRAAMVGLVMLTLIGAACIVLPSISDFLKDPTKTDLVNRNLKPGAENWFGTDHLGRDLFSRVIFGGRISIAVGLITTMVSVTIGIVWGAVAGYAGGRTDAFLMRIVDILYALPFLVIIILLSKILEPMTNSLTEWAVHFIGGEKATQKELGDTRNWVEPLTTLVPVFIAIGALSWLTVSRIVRAQVQSVASLDYVEAARSLGLGHLRILFRHILPNTLGPIIVYTTLTIPGVMMFEATLSFLGLGVKAPNSSWGVLIKEGADFMLTNPMQLVLPSVFFSVTLFSLNFLGDGLRDALDPKASKD